MDVICLEVVNDSNGYVKVNVSFEDDSFWIETGSRSVHTRVVGSNNIGYTYEEWTYSGFKPLINDTIHLNVTKVFLNATLNNATIPPKYYPASNYTQYRASN